MNMELFADALADICAHSFVAPGRPLVWIVIANPYSGGFTIKSRWKKHETILEEFRRKARSNPRRNDARPSEAARHFASVSRGNSGRYDIHALAANGLVLTERPGHGGEIARALVNEVSSALMDSPKAAAKETPFYLLITAGGDGTSLEVLSALYNAPPLVRENAAVFRLPMGTGNDGADAPELDAALEILVKPVRVEHSAAVRLVTSPGGPAVAQGPFLAFNILSVGLDAFVTHMTNRMKDKLPGDSYKLWVDIAALLYDRLYKVGFMDVKVLDEQLRETDTFREKILLLALGASGHRTYGSHKKILPDDRNVCLLRQMPLLRKLALKEMFNTGTHITKPEAKLFNAHRVEFSAEHPILAQMDGETVLLQREDFPAAIELTGKVIPILKSDH